MPSIPPTGRQVGGEYLISVTLLGVQLVFRRDVDMGGSKKWEKRCHRPNGPFELGSSHRVLLLCGNVELTEAIGRYCLSMDAPSSLNSKEEIKESPRGGLATKRIVHQKTTFGKNQSNNRRPSSLHQIPVLVGPASHRSPAKNSGMRFKFSSAKVAVLIILSLQNSLYTLLRRYSLGVRKEEYSKYELLLVGEIIKLVFSAWMIQRGLASSTESNASSSLASQSQQPSTSHSSNQDITSRLIYLLKTSSKMIGLALIYGVMNILSLVALRNIGAGLFTIFAQTKILTTATFSTILLRRRYSWTQWRALAALSLGVLVFSEPEWRTANTARGEDGSSSSGTILGLAAVLTEVTLSGFASIYFEKVIKTDPLQLSIWERNFQLALGSVPVYVIFIIASGDPFLRGWSFLAALVATLGAAGGLLVALSIKYGDAILKTLATTAAIVLSSVLDAAFLGGVLTPVSMISCLQVIVAICNYTLDATPPEKPSTPTDGSGTSSSLMSSKDSERPVFAKKQDDEELGDEEMSLLKSADSR